MTRELAGGGLGLLCCAAALCQTPAAARDLSFEVASIKPSAWTPRVGEPGVRGTAGAGGGCPTSFKVDPGRIDIRCATPAMLIGYAYRISPDRVNGPDWMMTPGSPRFDIEARIAPGATKAQVPEMLQALLADRFKLLAHRGGSEGPVYALVVVRGGLKMKEAAPSAGEDAPPGADAAPGIDNSYGSTQIHETPGPDGRGSSSILNSPSMGTVRETGDPCKVERWESTSVSLPGLADLLDKELPLPSPVVDRTGLAGRYRMALEVSLSDLPAACHTAPSGGDSQADTEQIVLRSFNDGLARLGLRLERGRGTVEAVFVDRVEKSASEN
jgi:uncharacterized protein (TIGR03435 family)